MRRQGRQSQDIWRHAGHITWPRLPSGQVDLADDTFRELSRSVPRVAPLRELRTQSRHHSKNRASGIMQSIRTAGALLWAEVVTFTGRTEVGSSTGDALRAPI